MIRAIIIDDEPSAINVLNLMLKKKCKDDIQVVATTTSPHAGKMLIEQHKPDLVFLDIEMPGMSGIELVRSFQNPSFRVVFVTAYDSYAIEAFRLSAMDYLLKPVGAAEVVRVITRIKDDFAKNQNRLNEQLQQLEKLLNRHSDGGENKIGISMAEKIVFINIGDIIYCEASGSYCSLYMRDGEKMMTSRLLGDFETQLEGHNFFRIHHHYLINLSRIKEYQRNEGGYVIMENGNKLEVSQRKRKDFLDVVKSMIV
jgi:two-component system LytT family response regulator